SAVVAVTFFALRDHSGSNAAPNQISSDARTVAVATSAQATASRETRIETVAATATTPADETSNGTAVAASESAGVAPRLSTAAAPKEFARMIPLIGASQIQPTSEEASPSARVI